jgi:nucleoside phosphorylase
MEGFNIVITLLCNSGKATAVSTAASLRSSYPRIKLLLLTGICDGVPKVMGKELLLGDIVISETVVQYDLGSRYADEFCEKDTLEETLGRPDKNVRNLITVLKTDVGLERLEEKVSSYLRKIQSRASEKQD